MSNFYIKTKDNKCWLAQDWWDKYRYYHMVNGYHGELIDEETMKLRYGDYMQYTL